jgi:hypothetical protein
MNMKSAVFMMIIVINTVFKTLAVNHAVPSHNEHHWNFSVYIFFSVNFFLTLRIADVLFLLKAF